MADVEGGGTVSVEHTTPSGQTFNVQSNTGTESQVRESLSVGEDKVEVTKTDGEGNISKAASELGKKGGEAAAKSRAKAAREAKRAEKEDHAESEDSTGTPEAGETEADEADGDPGETPETPRKDKRGDPRHDPTARVAEATRAAREARQELERERREKADLARKVAEYERGQQTRGPEQEQEVDESRPPEPPGKPKIEDFESYEQWLDARDEWRDQKREAESRAREEYHGRQRYVSNLTSKLSESLQTALKSDPSLRDRVSEEVWALRPSWDPDEDGPRSAKHGIADLFHKRPDIAPPIMVYLSENPDEFQRIAALRTPDELSWEMAKLVARLDAAPTGNSVEDVPVSKAKPPIRPVSGEAMVADGELYGGTNESLEQYAAKWNKKVKPTLLRR